MLYDIFVHSLIHIFRFGKAKSNLDNFEESKKYFLKAKKLSPNNKEITAGLENLLIKQEKYKGLEKAFYQNMFRSFNKKSDEVNSDVKEKKETGSEFQVFVYSQIEKFINNPSKKELSFPQNLSKEQIEMIKSYNNPDLKLEIKYNNNSPTFKLVKK